MLTVHNQVRVGANHAEGRKALAGYMLRPPFSLEKTSLRRSKLHATLKRNFQVMPGAQWLELLCKRAPDRHEHMVRYYGRYSSRSRGSEHERPDIDEPGPETRSDARQAAKAAWAKMIRKLCEVDPLACPECGVQMRLGSGTRRSPADLHPLASARACRSLTIPSPISPEASSKRRSQSSLFPNLPKRAEEAQYSP